MSRRSSSSTPQMRFNGGKVAARQKIEILEQRLHRRIEPVALRQAAAQGIRRGRARRARPARTSGRRRAPRSISSAPTPSRSAISAVVRPHVAVVVEVFRQFAGDEPRRRIGKREGDLLADMVAQGDRPRPPCRPCREAVCRTASGAAAARRLPLRGQIRSEPFRGAGIVGKNILERAVELVGDRFRRPGRARFRTSRLPRSASSSCFCNWSVAASSRGSARSSRGLRSISSSTKRSSSIWVSCSSLMDCISCGVITSDCDCLS